MTRTAEALTLAITTLDVRNNPLFIPGKLLVPADLAAPPLALWNGQQYGVMPYTRCNGYAGVLFALLGCPIPWKPANELFDWFPSVPAIAQGWRDVGLVDAVSRANGGFPLAIVAKENPHGHIGAGAVNAGDPSQLYCTAAGSANTPRMRFVDQFGQLAQRARFYTHD